MLLACGFRASRRLAGSHSMRKKERKKEEKSPGMFIQVRTHLGHTQEKERERETMKTFPVGMKEEDKRKGEMMNAGKKRKG